MIYTFGCDIFSYRDEFKIKFSLHFIDNKYKNIRYFFKFDFFSNALLELHRNYDASRDKGRIENARDWK